MKKKSLVSIIIPTHNRRILLEETVQSVLKQRYQNWELFIIDDCSTDDTWEYLSNINHEKVYPLKMEINVERSKARNIGLSKSSGDYVLFLDDDDLLTESALELLVSSLEKYPDAVACIGGYVTFDETGFQDNMKIVNKTCSRNIFNDFLFGWVATAGHTLFRADNVREIGGWNEKLSFAEDHELWFKLAVNKNVVLIPDIILEYRVHGQWRPDNLGKIMTDLRLEAVNRLPENRRRVAKNILKARSLLPAAEDNYENFRAFKALIKYVQIAWYAPSLLLTPLSFRLTSLPLMKCFLTGYGMRIGVFVVSFLKRSRN